MRLVLLVLVVRVLVFVVVAVAGRGVDAALLELGARLQGLYAAVLTLNLSVGAGEEEGYVGAYLVAEGCFCGGEARLGDELVVLVGLAG